MLTGENPWGKRLMQSDSPLVVLHESFLKQLKPEIPSHVSPECKDFILRCLNYSYKDRPYANELLEDPWVAQLGRETKSS